MAEEKLSEETEAEYPPMKFTEEMQYFVYEGAKWTKIISIFGLVLSVFMFFISLTVGAMFDTLVKTNPALAGMPGGAAGMSVLYMVFAVICFIPSLFLYQFSGKVKDGISYNSEKQVSEAFGKLLSHFKFIGISVLVIIVLYVLLIISSLF